VSQALDAVCAPVSLYDPVYSDGGDPLTVMDQVKDVKNTENAWMEHITLQNAFRTLSPREKQILFSVRQQPTHRPLWSYSFSVRLRSG
jgi:RNA polymerase sporulation-specific sigma factor